jgi:hypothetical protein
MTKMHVPLIAATPTLDFVFTLLLTVLMQTNPQNTLVTMLKDVFLPLLLVMMEIFAPLILAILATDALTTTLMLMTRMLALKITVTLQLELFITMQSTVMTKTLAQPILVTLQPDANTQQSILLQRMLQMQTNAKFIYAQSTEDFIPKMSTAMIPTSAPLIVAILQLEHVIMLQSAVMIAILALTILAML